MSYYEHLAKMWDGMFEVEQAYQSSVEVRQCEFMMHTVTKLIIDFQIRGREENFWCRERELKEEKGEKKIAN